MTDAIAFASHWFLERGNSEQATALAQTLLRQDPANERAHQVLIDDALRTGDIAAAATAVDRCVDALGELGVPPSPDTARLVARFGRRSTSLR